MRQRIVYCGLLLQYGLYIYPQPFLQQGKLADHTTSLIRYLDDSQSPVICIERDDQWIQESFKISYLKARAFSEVYKAVAHPIRTQAPSAPESVDADDTYVSTPFKLPPNSLGRAEQFYTPASVTAA